VNIFKLIRGLGRWAIPVDKGLFKEIPGLTAPDALFSHKNAKYCSTVKVSMSTPTIFPADIEFRERREIMK
ncbi:hypothetical protein Tco_1423128, partial [Tanacetum coccineum]